MSDRFGAVGQLNGRTDTRHTCKTSAAPPMGSVEPEVLPVRVRRLMNRKVAARALQALG